MGEAFEMHGVWASAGTMGQWVRLAEVEGGKLELSYLRTDAPQLTPEEARYLARKLYRLARRIEKRSLPA